MHYLLNSVLYITIYIHIPQCIRSQSTSIYTSTNIPAIYIQKADKKIQEKTKQTKKKKNRFLRFQSVKSSQVKVKSKSSHSNNYINKERRHPLPLLIVRRQIKFYKLYYICTVPSCIY